MRPMPNKQDPTFGIGPTRELNLRVSVAVLARVLFRHPVNGTWMLALERKATLVNHGEEKVVVVKTQPFGGAVRISDLQAFQKNVGKFHFDSSRSREENDFRIFIKPSNWPFIKHFCLKHLKVVQDTVLENDPARELVEEFEESLSIKLRHDQFTSVPEEIIVEESPAPTMNNRARGYPTVRVYQVFETILTDSELLKLIVLESQQIVDEALSEQVKKDSRSGGKGRANAILVMPLKRFEDYYAALPFRERNESIVFDGHLMAETIPVILEGVEAPKFKRIYSVSSPDIQ